MNRLHEVLVSCGNTNEICPVEKMNTEGERTENVKDVFVSVNSLRQEGGTLGSRWL